MSMIQHRHPLGRLTGDRRGSIGIIFGAALLPAVLLAGAAVDYAQAVRARENLQKATDSAAIAGASLLGASAERREQIALASFKANLPASMQSIVPNITGSLDNVRVTANWVQPTSFMKLAHVNQIAMGTKANVTIDTTVVNGSICLLALRKTNDLPGVYLNGNTTIADQDCWAWANSGSFESLRGSNNARARAAGFCTAGGVTGQSSFEPTALTQCAQRPDPFETKMTSMPNIDTRCDHNNRVQYKNETVTVSPSTGGVRVYCGGFEVKQATVTFEPGLYILKGGKMDLQAQAKVYGTGVTFLFADADAGFEMQGGADLLAKAPTSGDYAGFLLVDYRGSHKPTGDVVITGGGDIKMEGILYMPSRMVQVAGNGQINQASKFFAMVADRYDIRGTGDMYLKTDFASAGFPDLLAKVKRLTRMVE